MCFVFNIVNEKCESPEGHFWEIRFFLPSWLCQALSLNTHTHTNMQTHTHSPYQHREVTQSNQYAISSQWGVWSKHTQTQTHVSELQHTEWTTGEKEKPKGQEVWWEVDKCSWKCNGCRLEVTGFILALSHAHTQISLHLTSPLFEQAGTESRSSVCCLCSAAWVKRTGNH